MYLYVLYLLVYLYLLVVHKEMKYWTRGQYLYERDRSSRSGGPKDQNREERWSSRIERTGPPDGGPASSIRSDPLRPSPLSGLEPTGCVLAQRSYFCIISYRLPKSSAFLRFPEVSI